MFVTDKTFFLIISSSYWNLIKGYFLLKKVNVKYFESVLLMYEAKIVYSMVNCVEFQHK